MKLLTFLFFALFLTPACGTKSSDPEETAVVAPTWTSVSTIITNSCLTAACHSSGANTSTCGNFTTSEASYKAAQACAIAANTPAARVQLTKPNVLAMPSTGSLTADQIRHLVNFK